MHFISLYLLSLIRILPYITFFSKTKKENNTNNTNIMKPPQMILGLVLLVLFYASCLLLMFESFLCVKVTSPGSSSSSTTLSFDPSRDVWNSGSNAGLNHSEFSSENASFTVPGALDFMFQSKDGSPEKHLYCWNSDLLFPSLLLLIICYAVHFVECCHSSTWIELRSSMDWSAAQKFLTNFSRATPVLWWSVVTYRRKMRWHLDEVLPKHLVDFLTASRGGATDQIFVRIKRFHQPTGSSISGMFHRISDFRGDSVALREPKSTPVRSCIPSIQPSPSDGIQPSRGPTTAFFTLLQRMTSQRLPASRAAVLLTSSVSSSSSSSSSLSSPFCVTVRCDKHAIRSQLTSTSSLTSSNATNKNHSMPTGDSPSKCFSFQQHNHHPHHKTNNNNNNNNHHHHHHRPREASRLLSPPPHHVTPEVSFRFSSSLSEDASVLLLRFLRRVLTSRCARREFCSAFDHTKLSVTDGTEWPSISCVTPRMNRVEIQKCFDFSDEASLVEYKKQKFDLLNEALFNSVTNENLSRERRDHEVGRFDGFVEMTETLDLVSFNVDPQGSSSRSDSVLRCPNAIIVTSGPGQRKPWYCRTWTLWLAALTVHSWPLRLFINRNTDETFFPVVKIFGTKKAPAVPSEIPSDFPPHPVNESKMCLLKHVQGNADFFRGVNCSSGESPVSLKMKAWANSPNKTEIDAQNLVSEIGELSDTTGRLCGSHDQKGDEELEEAPPPYEEVLRMRLPPLLPPSPPSRGHCSCRCHNFVDGPSGQIGEPTEFSDFKSAGEKSESLPGCHGRQLKPLRSGRRIFGRLFKNKIHHVSKTRIIQLMETSL